MIQSTLNLMPPASPFAGLTFKGYGVILADPAWTFKNWSVAGEEKNPNQHYPCMTDHEIALLPVGDLAAPDSWALVWGTAPKLDTAIDILRGRYRSNIPCSDNPLAFREIGWDFNFVTAGAWGKASKTGKKTAFGPGYVRRSAAEFYLIGKRGHPPTKPAIAKIRNLMSDAVREHSRKPDRTYDEIEAGFHGPYLELFARARRPGWDAWGNEVGKFA